MRSSHIAPLPERESERALPVARRSRCYPIDSTGGAAIIASVARSSRLRVRALRTAYRRQAKRHGLDGGETGMVTSLQRFGGARNLHVHFHTLVLDGVFLRAAGGVLHVHSAPRPRTTTCVG